MKKDMEILGMTEVKVDGICIKDVIKAYRKQALKVHPDKMSNDATEEEIVKATENFKQLNESYQRFMKFVIEKHQNEKNGNSEGNEEMNNDENGVNEDDDEIFMKDNFKSFNFPQENDGSFTVIIQHDQADMWQDCLEEIYGKAETMKNKNGTIIDRLWKFDYEYQDTKTQLTVHIYNKPKNRKPSKLLIQGGAQVLIYMFVFNVLPQVYFNVLKRTKCGKPKSVGRASRSQVVCGQCKMKSTITEMKMHLKTAHGKSTVRKPLSKSDEAEESLKFDCQNCDFRTGERIILIDHIEAVHVMPLRKDRQKKTICNICDSVEYSEDDLKRHMDEIHEQNKCSGITDGQSLREELLTESYQSDMLETCEEGSQSPVNLQEVDFNCEESGEGFSASKENHNHLNKTEEISSLNNKILRLQSELNHEKQQHQNHLEALELSLTECRGYEKTIESLTERNRALEDMIKLFKVNEDMVENAKLKNDVNEKDKQLKKLNVELQKMQSLNQEANEALNSTVLEREHLRESERILLNTLDMMKTYVDQVKEKEASVLAEQRMCGKCKKSSNEEKSERSHTENNHEKCSKKTSYDDMKPSKSKDRYCCEKCDFSTYSKQVLEEHFKKSHNTIIECKKCCILFTSQSKLKDHIDQTHQVHKCTQCSFYSSRRDRLNEHTEYHHNRTFECKLCPLKTRSRTTLRTHLEEQHNTAHVNYCNKCGLRSSSDKELKEHMKSHHIGPKDPCIFWNRGYCRNGEKCRFSHSEIPACKYQEKCTIERCSRYHFKKSLNNFLGRNPVKRVSLNH